MTERVVKVFVLTVSDSCYSDLRTDKSGQMLKDLISNLFLYKNIPYECASKIVPDESIIIEEEIIKRIDLEQFDLILTTGGTGLSDRDCTPEATKRVITKEAHGISVLMLLHGLKNTPFASLSRAVCGVRNRSLILNFPGSLKAVKECFDAVSSILIHALNLLNDAQKSVKDVHDEMNASTSSLKLDESTSLSPVALNTLDSHSCPRLTRCNNSFSVSDGLSAEMSGFQFRKRSFEIEEAVSVIAKEIPTIKKEPTEFELLNTLNLVCASNLLAPINIPEVSLSSMDGFAIIAPLKKDTQLKCIERIYTGAVYSTDINIGACSYVSTGSVIPPSANSVIPIELVEILPDQSILILQDFDIGMYIRKPGSDVKKSECAIKAGECLSSSHIALAASLGFKKLMCYRQTKIGILSTGNEIKPIFQSKQYYETYDVNSIILTQEINSKKLGILTDYGIVADQFEIMKTKLCKMIEENDVIITTGGASVGEKDYIRNVLMEIGAQIFFEKVNMKPGKPTSFSSIINEKGKNVLIFSLPGNPVSCFVTFKVFVLPALAQLCKMRLPPQINVQMGKNMDLTDARPEYIRVNFINPNKPSSNHLVLPLKGSGCSSQIMSICGCDAIALLPGRTEELKSISKGTIVPAILLN